jgi:Peptidase M16 inactive domain
MNLAALPTPGKIRAWDFPRPSLIKLANGLVVLKCEMPGHNLLGIELALRLPLQYEPHEFDGISAVLASALAGDALRVPVGEADEHPMDTGDAFAVSTEPHGIRLRSVCPAASAHDRLRRLNKNVRSAVFTADWTRALVDDQVRRAQRDARLTGLRELGAVHSAMFGLDHRLGRPWQGSADTLRRIGAAELEHFHGVHVQPHRAALIIAGDLPREIDSEIAACFGSWEEENTPLPSLSPLPAVPGARHVLIERQEYSQCHITVAYAITGASESSWPALLGAVYHLGGAQLSLLDLQLREKLGYTFGLRASAVRLPGGGAILIRGFLASEHAPASCRELLRILARFREQGCSIRERDAVVESLRGSAVRQLQTPRSVVGAYAEALVCGLPASYPGWLHRALADVSADDIRRAAAAYLCPERQVLVVSGRREHLEQVASAIGIG